MLDSTVLVILVIIIRYYFFMMSLLIMVSEFDLRVGGASPNCSRGVFLSEVYEIFLFKYSAYVRMRES